MPRLTLCLDEPIATIRPELYGQFAEHLGGCVYGGLWVGEGSPIPNEAGLRSDVLAALTKLSIPVLRWPGGCFADDYHWEDGVGPPAQRPRRLNAWWGHDVDDNRFGTHEFLQLCRRLGAKPYLAGNVGSGTPRAMKQWVEYCNGTFDTTLVRRRIANGAPQPFDVGYWGVGNESWGCGGSMCPEDYAGLYKRFATYLGTFSRAPTRMPLTLIACGPNGNNLDWTRRFLAKAGPPAGDWMLHGLGAHYYAGAAGAATVYDADQWYTLLHRAAAVEKLILDQRAAMDEFDPHRRIGLLIDEWGTWHPPTSGVPDNQLWQQNTLRDALVAAVTLNIFNRHADKLLMCNIAQLVNVLQAMVLTDEDRMLLTPTYHVFDLYQGHQGGTAVRCDMESRAIRFADGESSDSLPGLSASASVKDRTLTLSIANCHATLPAETTIDLRGGVLAGGSIATLVHDDITAHNTFAAPSTVMPTHNRMPESGAAWTQIFPPASVTVIRATLGH
jgi:alpha-N-arabinofuranosidase